MEFLPSDILKPFISRISVVESIEEATYKVLPGTGLVVGFQYRGGIAKVTDDGKSNFKLSSSGITGLNDSYRIYNSAANTGSVLVYFNDGGAAPFFREPLHEIFKESASLDNFMLRSELLVFEEQLCEAKSNLKKVDVVENFLKWRLRNLEVDKLVMTAVALIHKSNGLIRISELIDQLHISQAPLEKRFRKVIGASPKKFASIVRMRNAIKNYDPKNSLTELGLQAGFYDQAHFIKEFKTFTGELPGSFLKSN
jgi:AraC-like DNA-binding protein